MDVLVIIAKPGSLRGDRRGGDREFHHGLVAYVAGSDEV